MRRSIGGGARGFWAFVFVAATWGCSKSGGVGDAGSAPGTGNDGGAGADGAAMDGRAAADGVPDAAPDVVPDAATSSDGSASGGDRPGDVAVVLDGAGDSSADVPPPPMGAVVEVSAGGGHTCARFSGGTVRCWGLNSSGQLGDGTTTSRLAPVAVAGLTGAIQIAAGGVFTCALLSDRTVRCWGANYNGQLGTGAGDESDHATPTPVPGLSDVAQIAAGQGHACVRLGDGTVSCWGSGDMGQLGTLPVSGCVVSYCWRSPRTVGGVSNAIDIAASYGTSFARLGDGTTWGWGENNVGQVDGSPSNPNPHLTAVEARSAKGAAGIAPGSQSTCAWRSDGSVTCWGWNAHAELGDPSIVGTGTSASVPGLSAITRVASGLSFSCALRSDGAVLCWGEDTNGAIGDGPASDTCNFIGNFPCRMSPSPVTGLTTAASISAGQDHACSVTANADVMCWGLNDQGQLGDGTTTNRDSPVQVVW